MPVSKGLAAASVVVALLLHLAASGVFRNAPLAGMRRFGEDVAAITGRPELAGVEEADPVRVVLGKAARAPFEGPGPRATLDPRAIRRPPSLGSAQPDFDQRVALAYDLFSPRKEEPSVPLRVQPPQSEPPSWFDSELSLAAVELNVRPVVRKLAGRFFDWASLIVAGEKSLRTLDPKAEAGRLDLAPEPHKLWLPTEWADPPRALRVPEVFVDAIEAGS